MSITFADIEAAAGRLAGMAVETPLLESPALNDRAGRRILIKPETLQRVGAFKFRGAWNRVAQMTAEERRAGVVAFSSGNHAQGVALAARLVGAPAVIVMPKDAPTVKVEATRGYGAEVVFYDRATDRRELIAGAIAAERGAVVIPAYDDLAIIAGQGTVGLEIARQAAARDVALDLVVTPVGGGGLLAGTATAMRALSPDTRLWGAEPEGYDDTRQSLAAGQRVSVGVTRRTLCDALEAPSPGELTFPILQKTVEGVVAVSDPEVAEAVRYAAGVLKLVVEPGGSAALAALLAGKLPGGEGAVAVVLSGGNIDPGLMGRLLAGEI